MPVEQFLNVLGSSVGFMAALYFALGVLRSSDNDLYHITSMKWDVNQHWADSIAEQRADYIVGSTLLLVSFFLQLAANLAPSSAQPSLLQPLGCAIAEIVVVVACLLVCSLWYQSAKAKATKAILRQWRAEELATLDAKLNQHNP